MQGGDIVALRLLLAVQRKGQAADVGLTDDEALAGLVVGKDGKVKRLLGTRHQVLLHVEVAHGHNDFLFDADFTLACRCFHNIQVVLRHVVFAFPHAPIHQRDGDADRYHLLLHRAPVGFAELLRHLIETHAGIDAGIEAGLLLRLVHILFGFQYPLTKFQKLGVIGLRRQQGLIHRYVQPLRTPRKRHPDIRVLLHIQERGKREHGTLQGAGGVLQRVPRIHHVQFQRQQVGTADGGNLQALHADAVEGIGGDGILLRQIVLRLCHGKRKEVVGRLLGDLLGVVDILFLHLLILQRLNLAFPAERIVADQALRIAQPHRHAGELGIFIAAEAPHIA